ncbi:MAG: Txe/YoeB family addiction module toxin [Bacteroidia bacterium]|nr:Txe/YoeB family addiction module toxin [Bacteroidia bacterium]
MYRIEFQNDATKDALKLQKLEPPSYKKLQTLVEELKKHPRFGTGKPERLKHYKSEIWSRHITRKHRLVYEIKEDIITVEVISTYGHYDEK